jgi:hypothetical protein
MEQMYVAIRLSHRDVNILESVGYTFTIDIDIDSYFVNCFLPHSILSIRHAKISVISRSHHLCIERKLKRTKRLINYISLWDAGKLYVMR